MSEQFDARRALFDSERASLIIDGHQQTVTRRGRGLALSCMAVAATAAAYGTMGLIASTWAWLPAAAGVLLIVSIQLGGRALRVPLPPARTSSTSTAVGTALLGAATIALCTAPHGVVLAVATAAVVLVGTSILAILPILVSGRGLRTK